MQETTTYREMEKTILADIMKDVKEIPRASLFGIQMAVSSSLGDVVKTKMLVEMGILKEEEYGIAIYQLGQNVNAMLSITPFNQPEPHMAELIRTLEKNTRASVDKHVPAFVSSLEKPVVSIGANQARLIQRRAERGTGEMAAD